MYYVLAGLPSGTVAAPTLKHSVTLDQACKLNLG